MLSDWEAIVMKIQQREIDIKKTNFPATTNLDEVYALIERVTNKTYADAVLLELYEGDGFDAFEVSDKEGKILIRGTSGVALASAFNTYLKERCGYSIGILTTSGKLPATPPAVGETITKKSKFLYRYFFNYCTFSYTYSFDVWEDWEKTIDYLLLSGYNLILNPIGFETIWRETLLKLDYTEKEIQNYLCGPAFYAWQWMMNMTGWAGGVPLWWYEARKELAGKFNLRVQAFGATTMSAGYAGMVPADFAEHFPDAKLIEQGKWCGFIRPAILMPEDPIFDRVASIFYAESKKIAGADKIHYYSVDPFHEGGRTGGIDLSDYSARVYKKMTEIDEQAVWVFQGWTGSPKGEMLRAIPMGRAIVTALSARADFEGELYSGVPWLYCAVFCFGGQYNYQGNAEGILLGPHKCLERDDANLIGMGYMPEGVNCNEIIYEILAYNVFSEKTDLESFVAYYLKTRYGVCSDKLVNVWVRLCREVLNGELDISGESAICARPTLSTSRTSSWSKKPNPFVDQTVFVDYISTMLEYYDELKDNPAYKKDLMEAARQALSNLSWFFANRIQTAYNEKNLEALSFYGKEMLDLIDLQESVVGTDADMMVGKWLEKAKRLGKTPAEKAYFEWNARVQITLWADREGAAQLRDYAAREWQGMLSDFCRPRWESFISRLEISLLTDTPLAEIHHYDEELAFVYRKKEYSTEPSGDLGEAARNALNKLLTTKVVHQMMTEKQADFEANVANDLG